MNKDLYLVRHGQTIFNLKRIIQGWSDSPLTQLGCDQAARAGMFLRARGIEPDHAYTSTLHRTEQTIANLWPGLAYERLDGLREWFFGDFEAERVMLMPSARGAISIASLAARARCRCVSAWWRR
ncbi:MAG: histidine phosphatase family protein [Collinsella sp.]